MLHRPGSLERAQKPTVTPTPVDIGLVRFHPRAASPRTTSRDPCWLSQTTLAPRQREPTGWSLSETDARLSQNYGRRLACCRLLLSATRKVGRRCRMPAATRNAAAAPRRKVRRGAGLSAEVQRDGASRVIRDCFVLLLPAASRAATTAVTLSRRLRASFERVAFDSLSANVRAV
jgi:hypothetical protein